MAQVVGARVILPGATRRVATAAAPALAAALCLLSCRQAEKEGPSHVPEEPLLLLDDSPPPVEPVPSMADNSRCHVCHLNYEGETLAAAHARVHIGCERCHGFSLAHASSEENVVAPDVMYPRDRIETSCRACHERLRPTGHRELVLGTGTERKVCTGCHGEHRLDRRSRVWDKATGELTERT